MKLLNYIFLIKWIAQSNIFSKCSLYSLFMLFVFLLQLDANEHEGRGFVFYSNDAFDCDRLMLIIHGSGVVRAGQWARRFVILTIYYTATTLTATDAFFEFGCMK